MSGGTVLVTSRSFGSGEADPTGWLRTRGLDVVRADRGHQLAELRPLLAAAIGWIAGTAPVTRDHLEAAPRLRVLARYGSGVESVDLEAAARRGVVITNTPGANAEAVADHTVALMLAALRHLVEADRERRSRRPGVFVGRELGALPVGLVGFGHVGRAVARRLRSGFGTRVLAVDPAVHPTVLEAAGVGPADLPTVAAACDVVSLHLPGGPRPVIDAGFVAAMRRHAVLVNTARGGLLDEAAVASALVSGDRRPRHRREPAAQRAAHDRDPPCRRAHRAGDRPDGDDGGGGRGPRRGRRAATTRRRSGRAVSVTMGFVGVLIA